jgi:hypothetical protein
MTPNQKSIVDSLINEFNRINSTISESKPFKLINADVLSAENRANYIWEQSSKSELESWEAAANEEAWSIVEMLKQDLPNAVVQKYGHGNDYYDLPEVLIKHPNVIGSHPSEVVTIGVRVEKEYKANEYGHRAEFGKKLTYRVSPSVKKGYSESYETLEEAVKDSAFIDALRKRVIR